MSLIKSYRKFRSWSGPTQIGLSIGFLALIMAIISIPWWSSLISNFQSHPDIEVYMVKEYADYVYNVSYQGVNDLPAIVLGDMPPNNKREGLEYVCGDRYLILTSFYEKASINSMSKVMGVSFGGKGCDNCYYYFLFARNFGKNYTGIINININSSTDDIEVINKQPGVEVESGGFVGYYKVKITSDNSINQNDLIPLALFRTKRVNNSIIMTSCSISEKGKCSTFNGVSKLWVIPKKSDYLLSGDDGKSYTIFPPVKSDHQLFLLNPTTNNFEESGTVTSEKC